jgi:hypothetical protein
MSYKEKNNHAANQRHWANKQEEWHRYLWATQMEEFPSSRKMDIQDVFAWCDRAHNPTLRANRYAAVALALQWPVGVFYGLGDSYNVRGFRYGTDGHEYMSGFSALESLQGE